MANLSDFYLYAIDLLAIPYSLREKLDQEMGIDADTTTILLSETDINFYNIPDNAILDESFEFDEDGYIDFIEDQIGKHPFYLLVGEHLRYNGVFGYKIIDNILDATRRSYDFSLEFVEKVGKSAILCVESSHDVPVGTNLYIIGLNTEEAEYLEECDFNDVSDFVQSKIKQ